MTNLVIKDEKVIQDDTGNVMDIDSNNDDADVTNAGMFCVNSKQIITGDKLFELDEHGDLEPNNNIKMEFSVLKDAILTGKAEVELGDLPSPLQEICDKYLNRSRINRE